MNKVLPSNDAGWVKNSFLITKDSFTEADKRFREFTSASLKFTDTRLGGNFSINNPPQFTYYADLNVEGRLADNINSKRHGGAGMGRVYSEVFDDNAQLIHMAFGVAKFNGMVSFFTGFYNNDAATIARTGRKSLFATLGNAVGFVLSLYAWPYILAGSVLMAAANRPSTKYYYLKETMIPYWGRVQNIANSIAVNLNLTPRMWNFAEESSLGGEKTNEGIENSDREYYYNEMPDIYNANGTVDVFGIATKAQRLADSNYEKMLKILDNQDGDRADLQKKIYAFSRQPVADPGKPNYETSAGAYYKDQAAGAVLSDQESAQLSNNKTLTAAQASGDLSTVGQPNENAFKVDMTTEGPQYSLRTDPLGTMKGVFGDVAAWGKERVGDYFRASWREGYRYVTFKVDYTGEIQESFSNSTGPSQIAGTLNGMSSTARNARFSFSDGNTGFGLIDEAFGAVRSFASGVLEGVHMSGLLSLSGAAFVDIPDQWENSSANFPTSSYTIQLRSPYGNVMSRYQNLFIPLSMLLAAALPISTGKQSYTSPFLCNLWSKGRNQIRLGIIDSISITRGVGNIGWTPDGHPLGIDVSFTIKDLSTVLHAPIASEGIFDGIIDDDNRFNDYLASLASLSIADQAYFTRRLAINLARKNANFMSLFSVARWTSTIMDSAPGQLLQAFAKAPSVSVGGR